MKNKYLIKTKLGYVDKVFNSKQEADDWVEQSRSKENEKYGRLLNIPRNLLKEFNDSIEIEEYKSSLSTAPTLDKK